MDVFAIYRFNEYQIQALIYQVAISTSFAIRIHILISLQ